jgi:hypothetical protein
VGWGIHGSRRIIRHGAVAHNLHMDDWVLVLKVEWRPIDGGVRVGPTLDNSVNGRQATFSAQPDRSREVRVLYLRRAIG